MDDMVLSVDGVAQLLNVSHDTVYRLARDTVIPGRKVGSQWRFSKAAVLAWLRDEALMEASAASIAVDSPPGRSPIDE